MAGNRSASQEAANSPIGIAGESPSGPEWQLLKLTGGRNQPKSMATNLSDGAGSRLTSPDRAFDADDTGLGELLRRARERRGLTLEQISKETKIPRRHLEALEHDNLSAIPGGFYRRAEIRAFARAVDLDQSLALAQLERGLEWPSAPEKPQTAAAQGQPSSRTHILIFIVFAVAAAALARWIGGGEVPALSDPLLGILPPAPLHSTVPLSAVSEGAPGMTAGLPDARPSGILNSASMVNTDPATADASADAFTELVVTTEPPGARVTVDGLGWGRTPATIRFLPPGSKRIRVIEDGYASEERLVNLVEGHPSSLNIRLHSAP
jgi:transcriptional regulator with XRE-family HTH domain